MPLELRDELESGIRALMLELPPGRIDQLLDFMDLLRRWNGVYNLTAVRDPLGMLRQHLLDSLSILPALNRYRADWARKQPAIDSLLKILDVGSGGGLPGVVLAIAGEGVDVTCIDAVGKKASFIRQAALELGLKNLGAIHNRIEQCAPSLQYDLLTSRAFASLVDFVRVTRHVVKPAGVWAAMKGKHPADEIKQLPDDIDVFHVEPLRVPSQDAERCLVWMRQRV
jgi:16S rRNA (guanine527-N7)-methyltransferase